MSKYQSVIDEVRALREHDERAEQYANRRATIIARLRACNPAQSEADAASALDWIERGDPFPLMERFNISRSAAHMTRYALQQGLDPIAVYSALLDSMGIP